MLNTYGDINTEKRIVTGKDNNGNNHLIPFEGIIEIMEVNNDIQRGKEDNICTQKP